MAKRRITAVVYVDKDWYDQTLRFLIGMPKSESTVDVHLLQGELKDANHHAGLWMKGVPSRHVTQGASVDLDYMIPWRFILGVGLVVKPAVDKLLVGFRATDVKPPNSPRGI